MGFVLVEVRQSHASSPKLRAALMSDENERLERAQTLLEQGNQLRDRGDARGALRAYEELLSRTAAR